jgi:murein DD-endopeptidase MepM/ murein hydrolase activator NlpD
MPRIALPALPRLLFVAYLCLAAPARGERGAGINADLAVDDALRALESQSTHNTQLANEVSALRHREQVLQDSLRAHVRALYRVTRSGSAPIAGGFPAMRAYLARVRRLKTMVMSDIAAVTSIRREQSSARDQARQGQRNLIGAQAQLAQLREAGAALPARLQTPVERAENETDRGFYGLRLTSGKTIVPFEDLRGKLAAPISGELRLRDVQRDNASALLFEAESGASVRASAAGRVVHIDAHTVVLDHGGGYQTAYGQLGNVEVRSGDEVSALARLGSVADSGEPALLFEVRKGSRSVPPRAWLGL